MTTGSGAGSAIEPRAIPAYLEVTPRRVVAAAIEWPGWCRVGRSAEEALERLEAVRDRYAAVAEHARAEAAHRAAPVPWPSLSGSFSVVAEVPGDATTAFGAPGIAPPGDDRPIEPAELERLAAIVRAAWATFDSARDAAVGLDLRLGPRGGGRELTAIDGHVREAEIAYGSKLGVRPPKPAGDDRLRAAILAGLNARALGRLVADPSGTRVPWLPRYFVRRSAWHALDHAWEIEDRAIRA
jgi:hypothetical protein